MSEPTVIKVYVRACGEESYSTNGLEFDTVKEARDYGNNLLSRWFGADSFEVVRVSVCDIPQRISGGTMKVCAI